jgi:tetratricopeptide (TPR) repeat protein
MRVDKWHKQYIQALNSRAEVYRLVGMSKEAIADYKQVLDVTTDVDFKVHACGRLSDISVQLGDIQDGLAYANQIPFLIKQLNDAFLEGRSLIIMANVLRNKGSYENALNMSVKALARFDRAQRDPYIKKDMKYRILESVAYCLHNMGMIYYSQGEYGSSLEYFKKSLERMKKLKDKLGEIKSLNNIALLYWHKDDLARAEKLFLDVLRKCKEMGFKSGIGLVLGNLGLIVNDRGRLNDGLGYFRQAYQLAKEVGDKSLVGIQLNNMGNTFERLGNLAEAMKYYKKSLVSFQEIGYVRGIAMTYNNVAEIYCDWSKLAEALTHERKAEEIAESANLAEIMVRCYRTKGRILRDLKKYKECKKSFTKSIKLAKKQNMYGLMIDAVYEYVWTALTGTVKAVSRLFDQTSTYTKTLERYIEDATPDIRSKCYVLLVLARYNMNKKKYPRARQKLAEVEKLAIRVQDKRVLGELTLLQAYMRCIEGKKYTRQIRRAEKLIRDSGPAVLLQEVRNFKLKK